MKNEEIKSVIKHVRFTPDEAAALDKKAAEHKFASTSDFVRRAVIKADPQPAAIKGVKNPVTLEALRLLSKQSNNLNQIAKQLNQSMLDGHITREKLIVMLKELQDISHNSNELLPSKRRQ